MDDKALIGRYQLVYGSIEVPTSSTSGKFEERKGLWKIDTVTGQVWALVVTVTGDEFRPIQTKEP
jgi:hypothetical protein